MTVSGLPEAQVSSLTRTCGVLVSLCFVIYSRLERGLNSYLTYIRGCEWGAAEPVLHIFNNCMVAASQNHVRCLSGHYRCVLAFFLNSDSTGGVSAVIVEHPFHKGNDN